jgi:hypothetical protein
LRHEKKYPLFGTFADCCGKETTGGLPFLGAPPVEYMIILFRLSQPQTVEQGSANRSVHGQAISTFKSRNGAPSLWSNNSIDYAVVITELAKTPLHSCNH